MLGFGRTAYLLLNLINTNVMQAVIVKTNITTTYYAFYNYG